MSNPKFTPGPWVLYRNNHGLYVQNDHGRLLCTISQYTPEEAQANAALIQSAPSLYHALSFCVSVMRSNGLFERSEQLAVENAEAILKSLNP